MQRRRLALRVKLTVVVELHGIDAEFPRKIILLC
jgi:hypothetical protein